MSPIYIIGAGAIGQSLAVFLQEEGKDVRLIRASDPLQKTTVTPIQVKTSAGETITSHLPVYSISSFTSFDGPLLICAKTMANTSLALQLKTDYPILLLQNGLHIETPFMDAGFAEVYRCVLFVTAQLTAEKLIRFKPVGPCAVGMIKGNRYRLQQTIGHIQTPYFNFREEPSIQPVIWKKAILNCAFNSICPLLETDNGIFFRNSSAFRLAQGFLAEGLQIANASGIELTMEELETGLLAISEFSDGQDISTLQDIREGRMTELDSLNAELVRVARSVQLETHVPQLKLAGELTQLKAIIHQRLI